MSLCGKLRILVLLAENVHCLEPCLFQTFFLNYFLLIQHKIQMAYIQSNFNGSNTDGSFTMAYSNSFLSPYGIFPIAQDNKYCGKFSHFIMRLYVVYTH